jgi:membrane protein implicated in regulation of membrane protease activity
MFGFIRGFLVIVSLVLAFIVGAAIIVPLAIFIPPLPIILAALLVLYVLGATRSMASDWHTRHQPNPHADQHVATYEQRTTSARSHEVTQAPVIQPG